MYGAQSQGANIEITGQSASVPQTTIMASTTSSKEFLQVIQNRRTIYELSKKPILADDALAVSYTHLTLPTSDLV